MAHETTAARILVVDDDDIIRETVAEALELDGYEVETAPNGADALDRVRSRRPSGIILDLMMPIMTGEDMLMKLRKTGWGKKIRVIILTNRGEQEIPDEVRKAGVEAIILKAAMTPRQVAELVKQKLGDKKTD